MTQKKNEEVKDVPIREKVSALMESIKQNGKDAFISKIPQKILDMDELYQSIYALPDVLNDIIKASHQSMNTVAGSTSDADDHKAYPGTKRKRPDTRDESKDPKVIETKRFVTPLYTNQAIVVLIDKLRDEILEQIDIMGALKLWIQMNVPRIEDGNNFGVSVQQETLGEITRMEDSAFAIIDSAFKYFASRAKIASKVVKYPHLEDYERAIIELDYKECINLKLCCLDVRNNYLIIYDVAEKNMEKLLQPRGNSDGAPAMY